MKVSAGFLKKGIVPEIEKWYNPQFLKEQDFVTNATLYFGIGWEEAPIRENWQPFDVVMPLMEYAVNHDKNSREVQYQATSAL